MEARISASQILTEIRDGDRLGHLRRRPRCSDRSLDKRHKVNRAFSKTALVTNYYDPADPDVDVEEAVIEMYLTEQQQAYDAARFEELTTRVRELEQERVELRGWKAKAQRLLRSQCSQLEKLWTRLRSQPQD